MLKQISCLAVIGTVLALSACGPSRVSMNPNYDMSRIKRVAVLDFEPFEGFPESSAALSVVFEKYLLGAGYQLVERSKVRKVMSEQHFQLTGAVDPTQAVSLGKILGVDALLLGSVTVFKESTQQMYVVETISTRQEPIVTRKQREMLVKGERKIEEVEEVTGYKTIRDVTRTPQTYTQQAESAAVVRMIDTTSGEIIWVGNAMEAGVDTQTASEYVAKAIMGDWQKIMRQNATSKAKAIKA